MAHRNREKRAARKAQEEARTQALYNDFYNDNYEEEPRRKRRGPHPAIVALIVTVAIIAGGFYGLKTVYEGSMNPVDPGNTREVVILVPQGSTTVDIATILGDRGLIKNEYFFRIHCQRLGYDSQFKYGEYTLTKSMSVDEIAEILMAGVVLAETKRFTIPEGYNIKQIAQTLAKSGIITESAFYNEVENGDFDYAFLDGCPPGRERLEGFLYPETYEVFEDVTAYEVVDKMLAQFNLLYELKYYARAQELGMSVREIVTMASIVERESVAEEERPIMAGVFYNRLEEGMKLESCATIQYILGEPKEFLTNADTEIPSPYNTYLHEGLPPGPICSPRIESIEAALYPDENNYIFFVLSEELNGTHMFSHDYNEFLRNKDAYYAAVESR